MWEILKPWAVSSLAICRERFPWADNSLTSCNTNFGFCVSTGLFCNTLALGGLGATDLTCLAFVTGWRLTGANWLVCFGVSGMTATGKIIFGLIGSTGLSPLMNERQSLQYLLLSLCSDS